MKLKYKEAMENLQAMFQNFDQETIHSILVMHKGAVQPTIEDLLRLSNEQELEDNDNMFANDGTENSHKPNNTNNNGLGDDFLDPNLVDSDSNEYYARKLQEKEDMKLAMALQKKYIASEQQQYQQEEEGEDEAQQENYDAQAMMKTGGYKKFSDEPDANRNKGKRVVPNQKPPQQHFQQQQQQQQQQEENQEVISFDLSEQNDQNGYVFHQYDGEEMKNNGLASQLEEMKVNDDDNDFKIDKKGISTKKKKSFWSNLFSKKTKESN